MAIASQGYVPKDVSVQGAVNKKITNLSILAGTEKSHALAAGLKQIIIRNRSNVETRLSFTLGETASNYITLNGSCTLELTGIEFTGDTLYALSATASTLEILELY